MQREPDTKDSMLNYRLSIHQLNQHNAMVKAIPVWQVPKKLLKEGFRVVSSLLDEVGRNNWWPIRGIQNFQQSGSALELLKSKNLKIKKSTLERFLEECDAVAPWFAVSGSLTVLSWDKLGRDLDFAAEQGTLRAGVRPISKMVRGCLEDQRCSEAIEYGKIALERLEEERSEITVSEKGAARGKSLYPNLEDFEFSEFPQTDSEGDGDSEEEFLAASVRSIRIRPTDHPKTRVEQRLQSRDMENVSSIDLQECKNNACFYTQYWNASRHSLALVARIPRWIPVPVDAPSSISLIRHKRDFGITVAVISALTIDAVGAITAAIAMGHTVQTTHTLNNLSATVSQVLDIQSGSTSYKIRLTLSGKWLNWDVNGNILVCV
ncbi:hypothetical protein STEG23_024739 [Scotinomys teguina]